MGRTVARAPLVNVHGDVAGCGIFKPWKFEDPPSLRSYGAASEDDSPGPKDGFV
jgi:hypothetical protein